jgi:Spy/CpxP family protein refolding chaperone
MTQHEDKKEQRKSRHGFWAGLILGGLLATVLAAGLAYSSVKAAGQWFGGPVHSHGRFASLDPEAAHERIELAVELVLGRVDASEAQIEEVKTILAGSFVDLHPLMAEHKANREAFVAELAKSEIDRNALEGLRSAEMALADQASNRVVNVLVAVAEVLTPEQRTELIEFAQRFRR